MSEPKTAEDWTEQIKKEVAENHIFVYAKGEKNAAMCGFSHRVMEILNQLGADYSVRNIFSDPLVRPTLCAFSNWPTTPQIFIDGKFVGGCDILVEMFENGELKQLIQSTKPTAP